MKPILPRAMLFFLTICFFCILGKTTDGFAQVQEEPAIIAGFRSAKFGISQGEIKTAIKKDFNIGESDISVQKNPLERTTSLKITVNDLLPNSGAADIFYILGHTSNNLIQVNIIWSKPSSDSEAVSSMALVGETLKSYFLKQSFKKDDMVINARLKDGSVLFFRGTDTNGQMVVLQMLNPPVENADSESLKKKVTSLRLTYVQNPNEPDIFQVKQGDF